MTLVEMMISLVILSVAVLGLIAAFGGVQRGIEMAKDKTLASNLAQEKMQIIQQQTYFSVVPTMTPASLPDGTLYDTDTFPPETITEGGKTFTRYTYVQVIKQNNGTLQVLPPTTPDTGLREITVDVEWQEGGETKKLVLNSVMANPDTVESNCAFSGAVTDAGTGLPIDNALVVVAENISWFNSTNAQGDYSIGLSPGSYNLVASAKGYFSDYLPDAVAANQTVTANFSLTRMSSGVVSGTAWLDPNVIISQVVVSTPQSDGFDVEYLDLYNPTEQDVSVSSITLNYVSWYNNMECDNVQNYLNYASTADTVIPAGGFYLVANTATFTVDGTSVAADAYYASTAYQSCSPGAYQWTWPTTMEIMARSHSGTWWITDEATGNTLDAAGWSDNGGTHSPSHCLGACFDTNGGLASGWELVRYSSQGFLSSSYGPAYKSGDDSVDFTTSDVLAYPPFNSFSSTQPVIAGVPAAGAVISATDGLSSPTTAYLVGSPPSAEFNLPNVATGTWTVYITSGLYELENDTVTIAATGSTYVFPSSTTILYGTATGGFVSGEVTDVNGNPISVPSPIEISGNGSGGLVYADAHTGYYLLPVSTGSVTVTANPNYANPDYISQSSAAISVALGEVASGVDFTLSQGGRLSGWVTRDGVNGLQGLTVNAVDSNGNTQDQETTDVYGDFTTVNMATGTYSIEVPLDTTESASPSSLSGTVAMGQTVFVGTFTISGAMGTIEGSVSSKGEPISTGVLIVVSTATTPVGLSSATLTENAVYTASSLEDGTYSVSVRQSTATPYNIYAYYPVITSTGAVNISNQEITGVTIIAGQTLSGKNFSW